MQHEHRQGPVSVLKSAPANVEVRMSDQPEIVLSLPGEEEIQSTAEIRLPTAPGIIQKTIRYKNGMELTLLQDFRDLIFSLSVRFYSTPFRLRKEHVLNPRSGEEQAKVRM